MLNRLLEARSGLIREKGNNIQTLPTSIYIYSLICIPPSPPSPPPPFFCFSLHCIDCAVFFFLSFALQALFCSLAMFFLSSPRRSGGVYILHYCQAKAVHFASSPLHYCHPYHLPSITPPLPLLDPTCTVLGG